MRNPLSARYSEDRLELLENIGFRINQARMRKRMTQDDLAKAVGTARTTITMLESGHVDPSATRLFKIAQVLGVELRDFFVP